MLLLVYEKTLRIKVVKKRRVSTGSARGRGGHGKFGDPVFASANEKVIKDRDRGWMAEIRDGKYHTARIKSPGFTLMGTGERDIPTGFSSGFGIGMGGKCGMYSIMKCHPLSWN